MLNCSKFSVETWHLLIFFRQLILFQTDLYYILRRKKSTRANISVLKCSERKKECGKITAVYNKMRRKTTQSIMTAGLYNGDKKSMLKLRVSAPQPGFAAEIFTAF